METIGEKLIKLRGNRSISDVANAIGVTTQAIWNYENDNRIPRDYIKKKIAEYYNSNIEDIFFNNKSND